MRRSRRSGDDSLPIANGHKKCSVERAPVRPSRQIAIIANANAYVGFSFSFSFSDIESVALSVAVSNSGSVPNSKLLYNLWIH